jgi:glutathione S-transferase
MPADRASAADVEKWWKLCYEDMGVWVAQWVYFYVLQDRELALRLMSEGVSTRAAAFQRPFFPLIAAVMKLGLRGLNAAVAANALQQVKEVFTRVEKRLESGTDYLVGERLTLADIGFCASAGAVTLSPHYGGAVPRLEEVPDAMRREVLKLRARPAAEWVERLRAKSTGL